MLTLYDLKSVKTAKARIRFLQRSMRNCRAGMTAISSGLAEHHGGAGGDRMAAYVARLDELQRELSVRIVELHQLIARIDRELERLDPEIAMVIRLRYLDGCTWVKVCDELHMSESTARRMLKQGQTIISAAEKKQPRKGKSGGNSGSTPTAKR